MTEHHTHPWHSDYLDNELTPDKKAEVEAHLKTCAECRDDMEKLKKLQSALRNIEVPDPGKEYFAGLSERIAARTVSPTTNRRVPEFISSRTDILKTLIRIAAVITLLFGAFYLSNLKREKEGARWNDTISKGKYVQSDSTQSLNYPHPEPGKTNPADSIQNHNKNTPDDTSKK